MSEPEIRDRPPGEIPKGWEFIARSLPAFTCTCGARSHYGWKKDGVRICEECGEKQFAEAQAVKEEGRAKRTRRKLT